jgi:prepilin-type N-terminal cleavage/methylation domain-containing protein
MNSSKGYTLIEVLIVIAITTIGFVALMNLQIGAMHMAAGTRDMQEAINLAEHVAQSMRMEALEWTPSTATPSGVAKFKFLGKVPAALNQGATSGWVKAYPLIAGQTDRRVGPVGNDNVAVVGYDRGILGEILPNVNAIYCVHYKLTWLIPDLLLRADIRVLWPTNQAHFENYKTCPLDMVDKLHDIQMISTPVTILRNVFVRQVSAS